MTLTSARQWGRGLPVLTLHEGSEEHPKPAEPAALVRPHSDHAHSGFERDVIGYRAAELGLEVFDGTASVVDGHEVPLALVGVLHLVIQEPQINLRGGGKGNTAAQGTRGLEFSGSRPAGAGDGIAL